jgi:cytochrome d ubiquinol oxidase subunit II
MELQIVWFILIAVLYTGYFVLEGFDMGVGMLLPFLGKDEQRRRLMINTVGPHWDGNEVWLITAAGASFAAFPQWYATLFSGFYLPLFLILVALIFRGVAFEFRSKDERPTWRAFWDWALCIGSSIPAFLWGVAFTNFVYGVPINADLQYVGGFWNLLNPYALLGGVVSLFAFLLSGAIFLSLKTTGKFMEQARRMAWRLWPPVLIALVAYIFGTYFATDMIKRLGNNPGVIPIGVILSLLSVGWLLRIKREGWAFGMMVLTIVLGMGTIFLGLYPRVLVSNPILENSLTIINSSSGPATLQVMTIVALIFVPFVLLYQGWTYWIFRKRLTGKSEELHY